MSMASILYFVRNMVCSRSGKPFIVLLFKIHITMLLSWFFSVSIAFFCQWSLLIVISSDLVELSTETPASFPQFHTMSVRSCKKRLESYSTPRRLFWFLSESWPNPHDIIRLAFCVPPKLYSNRQCKCWLSMWLLPGPWAKIKEDF